VIPILIGVFLGGCALGAFGVLVVGIHIEEHRQNTNNAPHAGRSELAARHVMGVYVRKPTDSTDSDQEGK
jgi:hypothetical protein